MTQTGTDDPSSAFRLRRNSRATKNGIVKERLGARWRFFACKKYYLVLDDPITARGTAETERLLVSKAPSGGERGFGGGGGKLIEHAHTRKKVSKMEAN